MSTFPWRTALFLSLALNLIVLSAGVGAYAAGARLVQPGAASAPAAALQRPAFMAALPPEARAMVRRDLAGAWMQTAALRADARAARQDVLAAARADTYDAARVKAALAHMREADGRVLASFHDAAADAMAKLTPAQRRAALDALVASRQGAIRRWLRGAGGEAQPPAPAAQ